MNFSEFSQFFFSSYNLFVEVVEVEVMVIDRRKQKNRKSKKRPKGIDLSMNDRSISLTWVGYFLPSLYRRWPLFFIFLSAPLASWFYPGGLSSCKLLSCTIKTGSGHEECFCFSLFFCMGVFSFIHLPPLVLFLFFVCCPLVVFFSPPCQLAEPLFVDRVSGGLILHFSRSG